MIVSFIPFSSFGNIRQAHTF